MRIRIGRTFEVDTRYGFYVKLPFIGAGHRSGLGWTWSPWAELKRTGEV